MTALRSEVPLDWEGPQGCPGRVVAVLVGWRTHENFGKVLAGFGLLLLLGYTFSWIGALIGLSVRTPEAATPGGLIWLFPLTFISNAFVPSENMPAFLRTIANWNLFSATVQACRHDVSR